MYQHMMDYWAPAKDEEAMQDDFYEIAADGWEAGKEVKYKEKKRKKGDEEITVTLTGIDGLEGRLIPPHLIIQEYFPTEKRQIEVLELKIEAAINEKKELQEEHGGEEAALQGVSTKKDADIALNDYAIQAMEEYYSSDFKLYSKYEHETAKFNTYFKKEYGNPYIEALKNAKGKIIQKALSDKLKITTNDDEKKIIETFVETIKKNTKAIKEMNDLVDDVMKKLETNIKSTPEADYIKEIVIIQKYRSLLETEVENKAKLKRALEELEKKVILKYPKLSIDEIKTIVVEKKWMANMEQRIRTEMDNISQRLTQRIKELADRYETPIPQLTQDVNILTVKVENHLKIMNFKW
jgi:type I restriction enzyme M protein